jgi:hypothetical protein
MPQISAVNMPTTHPLVCFLVNLETDICTTSLQIPRRSGILPLALLPLPVPILSQMNPVHTFRSYFFKNPITLDLLSLVSRLNLGMLTSPLQARYVRCSTHLPSPKSYPLQARYVRCSTHLPSPKSYPLNARYVRCSTHLPSPKSYPLHARYVRCSTHLPSPKSYSNL